MQMFWSRGYKPESMSCHIRLLAHTSTQESISDRLTGVHQRQTHRSPSATDSQESISDRLTGVHQRQTHRSPSATDSQESISDRLRAIIYPSILRKTYSRRNGVVFPLGLVYHMHWSICRGWDLYGESAPSDTVQNIRTKMFRGTRPEEQGTTDEVRIRRHETGRTRHDGRCTDQGARDPRNKARRMRRHEAQTKRELN